ncbi:hypothetical protein ACKFRS_00205 [Corynebacterium tuberculostearicum]
MTMTTMPTRASRQIGARGMPAKRTLWRSAAVACVVVMVAIAVATVGKPFIDIPGVVDASAHARRSLDLQMFNGFNNPHPWWVREPILWVMFSSLCRWVPAWW